jgi:signal transduction histidine kinase
LGNDSAALKYLKAFKDIVEKTDKNDELSRIADAEIKSILDKSQQEIIALEREQEIVNQENKIQRLWLFSTAGALISALLLLYILFRNNRNKQKTNALLKQQKEKVESTLEKLKSTQAQLIQSEKMASLGELTAGIAHEIQNPLNFVNNFSEVNRELIAELREELDNGNLEEVKEIATDLEQNEEKISHHGKRADAIVKGMLQHSRSSSGQKEPTDINVLADEYLRLAYHGLRAKNKSFNADFKLETDDNLSKVNVVPQDIGRVLLNLINNAFHAVSERNLSGFKNLTGIPQQENYKPTVTVYTKSLGDKIEIRVKDNGNGIPEDIKDKIFQPFFTTKPTGEGTGLGLSMSYDIITKGHGGELIVDSDPGTGTEFIIRLGNS